MSIETLEGAQFHAALPLHELIERADIVAGQTLAELATAQTIRASVLRRQRPERIQDLPEEEEIQAAFAADLGALVIGQTIERPEVTQSLADDTEAARRGEREALKKNALFVLLEGALAEGLAEVELTRDEQGRLVQHGHALRDVLAKGIELHPGDHPGLHEVTRTEAYGVYAIDALDKAGYFDNGDVWVAPRMVPTAVPARSIRQYGYFENLAVSWGITWKRPDGTLVMRSLFTAGVDVRDGEELVSKLSGEQLDELYQTRLDRSYYQRGVQGVYQRLGLPLPSKLVDYHRGFKIHKSYFTDPKHPNADLARWYDEALGPGHFVGTKSNRIATHQDYVDHGLRSLALQQNLDPLADQLVDVFLAEVEGITDAKQQAYLLARLGRKYIVDFVIDNPEVDARPLGLAATLAREEYYRLLAAGDHDAARTLRNEIHQIARANACGYGAETDDDPNNSSGAKESSKSKKRKMRWKSGICRIAKCPTRGANEKRPAKTIVGECSICWGCQKKFDIGFSAEEIIALYARRRKSTLALGA